MTNDITIDPSTGLPQLPSDHYWYISESLIRIFQTTPDWSEWEPVSWCGRTSWDGHMTLPEYLDYRGLKPFNSTKLPISQEEYRVEHLTTPRFLRSDLKTTIAFRRNRIDHAVYTTGYDEEDERLWVLKSNVLLHTSRVYRDWRTIVESEAIYGAYPPKRLES